MLQLRRSLVFINAVSFLSLVLNTSLETLVSALRSKSETKSSRPHQAASDGTTIAPLQITETLRNLKDCGWGQGESDAVLGEYVKVR